MLYNESTTLFTLPVSAVNQLLSPPINNNAPRNYYMKQQLSVFLVCSISSILYYLQREQMTKKVIQFKINLSETSQKSKTNKNERRSKIYCYD